MTPKRRFRADSPRSPSWLSTDATAETSTTIAKLTGRRRRTCRRRARRRRRPATPATSAAEKPGPGLLGADPRPQLRPAEAPAGEIGRDVGRPDHREHPQDADEPEARMLAHERRHERDHRRVGEAGGGPSRGRASSGRAPRRRRARRRRSPPQSAARRRRTRSPPGRRARRRARPGAVDPGSALVMAIHSKSTATPASEPEQGEDPAADRGRKQSHEAEHERRRDPQVRARTAAAAPEPRSSARRYRSSAGPGRSRPPKRRSRRQYSSIAARKRRVVEVGPEIRQEDEFGVGRSARVRKFETRCSPEVRMTRSGSGMPMRVERRVDRVGVDRSPGRASPRLNLLGDGPHRARRSPGGRHS